MKKLAIIGANSSITMLINKAKQLGYETHVFAWKCGAPGEFVADYFYPISIGDKEEILKKCEEIKVDGVCSITSDFAVPTVNYVARKLGLVSNPEETELLARNKFQMRLAFKKIGLLTPKFKIVDENFSINDLKDFKFPLIVKPIDGWSSKGVTRVDTNKEIINAVQVAINESFDKKAIVEEFIEGEEYSAEYICQNGQYYLLALTQKNTTGFPHYVEKGHIQPANIHKKNKENLIKLLEKGIKALKILNGAVHIEFRILPDNDIFIIEIGARMGGDCIGTDLVPISTGIDYIKMVIDVACGNKINFQSKKEQEVVEIKFILTKEDYNEFLKLKKICPIVKYEINDTNFSRRILNSSDRHGYYIILKNN